MIKLEEKDWQEAEDDGGQLDSAHQFEDWAFNFLLVSVPGEVTLHLLLVEGVSEALFALRLVQVAHGLVTYIEGKTYDGLGL